MTTEDFVRAFRVEKDRLLAAYLSDTADTAVGLRIRSMELSPEQTEAMRVVQNGTLTDVLYTILLGLDGCAGIGDMEQQVFRVQSEDGSVVCNGDGEVEIRAYAWFHDDAA